MELDVFYGELTATRAVVYARLPREPGMEHISLSGTVRGPRCLHAQTLPASFSLVDLGPGPTVLARGLVTEPTHWTPDLPAIYDVTVRVQRGADVLMTERREIGLRTLGTRGSQLVMGGKNWVLRGVSRSSTNAMLARQWHDASAAILCEDGDDEMVAEASQWGATCVVRLAPSGVDVSRGLRMLARFPGVAMVIVPGKLPRDFRKAAVAPNILLATELPASRESTVPDWADLVLVEAQPESGFVALARQIDRPVVAVRRLSKPTELDAARAACDALQRDLAALGQFAGYII